MKRKFEFNEDEAFHLNVGVPIILGFTLFIINTMLFSVKFLESLYEFILIYTFSSAIVFVTLFFVAKGKKNTKTKINISLYNFLVHNAFLVLVFLILNLNFSHTIFESNIAFDNQYNTQVKKMKNAPYFNKVYDVSLHEYEQYYNNGFELQVAINESFFGYKFIKQRSFVKVKP